MSVSVWRWSRGRYQLALLLAAVVLLAACARPGGRAPATSGQTPSAATVASPPARSAPTSAPAAMPTDVAPAAAVPLAPGGVITATAVVSPTGVPVTMPTDAGPVGAVPVAPTPVPATAPPAGPAARTITIDTPTQNQVVANPIDVRGRVSITPFENNLVYRATNQSANLVDEGAVAVTGEQGKPGTFSVEISPVGQPGDRLRIDILDISAADSSILASASVDLVLGAAPAGRKITIDVPSEGTAVSSPFDVRGQVNLTPFENNLIYRVYDVNNTLIGSGPVTVVGEQGQPGVFQVQVSYQGGAPGAGRVEILDINVADGTPFASVSVAIVLR